MGDFLKKSLNWQQKISNSVTLCLLVYVDLEEEEEPIHSSFLFTLGNDEECMAPQCMAVAPLAPEENSRKLLICLHSRIIVDKPLAKVAPVGTCTCSLSLLISCYVCLGKTLLSNAAYLSLLIKVSIIKKHPPPVL